MRVSRNAGQAGCSDVQWRRRRRLQVVTRACIQGAHRSGYFCCAASNGIAP